MSLSAKINQRRRMIMRSLTKNIGKSHSNNSSSEPITNVKNILVCRPNGRLGNQILITPLIAELEEIFPDSKVDLFVKGGLSNILFETYGNIDKIIQLPKKPFSNLWKYMKVWVSLKKKKYDLVVNVDGGSSSGRMATRRARSRFVFYSDTVDELKAKYSDYEHIAKMPVYNLRHFLSQHGFAPIDKPVAPLDIRLTAQELEEGKNILNSLVDPSKPTISIYTFATGSKCYTPEWWSEVYGKLKAEFEPAYNILEVLPVENVSQINFAAPSFYSKEIRKIAALIANTKVFFGADCGIMHLASSSLTPTIGMFAVTPIKIYQPYSNGSIALDTNKLSADDIVEQIKKTLSKAASKNY